MILCATRRAIAMGSLKNSITCGTGNLAGFIGEEIVKVVLPEAEHHDTYDYDLVINGATADVKTKRTNVTPLPHYECSIADYNTKQVSDNYIFCRVNEDYTTGWVLGYLPKSEYFQKATFMKQGEVDPRNNYTVKADCWNVPISELYDVNGLDSF